MTVAMATERSKKSAFLDIFLQYLLHLPSVNFFKNLHSQNYRLDT